MVKYAKKRLFKLLLSITGAVVLSGLILSGTALAAGNEILFGTIVSVDTENNQVIILTDEGEEITISVGNSDMQIGSSRISIDELEPGQTLGTFGSLDGSKAVSQRLTVIPSSPTYQHMTGVVTEMSDTGLNLKTRSGNLVCSMQGNQMGNVTVGEALTTIVEMPVRSGGAASISSYEPLEDTIAGIGNNMNQMPGNSGVFQQNVAVGIVNELGAITDQVPTEMKTMLQSKFNAALGTSIPSQAWQNMNADSGQNLQANGTSFIPSSAFGQMKPDTFSGMKPEVFGQMDPDDFTNMPPQSVSQIRKEAFGNIKQEQLPPGWSIAPDGGPMPPGAPGGADTVPVPTGPDIPPAGTGSGPGSGGPGSGGMTPGSGPMSPDGPNSPPDGITPPPGDPNNPPDPEDPPTPPDGVTPPDDPMTPPDGVTPPDDPNTPPAPTVPTVPPDPTTPPSTPPPSMPSAPPAPPSPTP